MNRYLLIRQLEVHAANAISSPLTFGFPAITAFAGFAHALQRQFNRRHGDGSLTVHGVGIISHQFTMLDHVDGYNRTLQLTGNPLNKDGGRASFVEEGRCHMNVSLVLPFEGLSGGEADLSRLQDIVFAKMKLAGGDLLKRPKIEFISDDRRSIRRLMPGYALMDRRDLMLESMNNGDDALTALHRHLAVEHRSTTNEDGTTTWTASRHQPGWIVPIATGFAALTPPEKALNARDPDTPHRFAESVVTLGEFKLVSRIERLADLVWRYQTHDDLYVCNQMN